MGIPIGQQYRATTVVRETRIETCVHCDAQYEYAIERSGASTGFSPLGLDNEGAAMTAREGASFDVKEKLAKAVEVVACPRCGWFQPNMVDKVQGQRLAVASRTALLCGAAIVMFVHMGYPPDAHVVDYHFGAVAATFVGLAIGLLIWLPYCQSERKECAVFAIVPVAAMLGYLIYVGYLTYVQELGNVLRPVWAFAGLPAVAFIASGSIALPLCLRHSNTGVSKETLTTRARNSRGRLVEAEREGGRGRDLYVSGDSQLNWLELQYVNTSIVFISILFFVFFPVFLVLAGICLLTSTDSRVRRNSEIVFYLMLVPVFLIAWAMSADKRHSGYVSVHTPEQQLQLQCELRELSFTCDLPPGMVPRVMLGFPELPASGCGAQRSRPSNGSAELRDRLFHGISGCGLRRYIREFAAMNPPVAHHLAHSIRGPADS